MWREAPGLSGESPMDASFTNTQAQNIQRAVAGVLGPAVALDKPEQIKEALSAVMRSKAIDGQVANVA